MIKRDGRGRRYGSARGEILGVGLYRKVMGGTRVPWALPRRSRFLIPGLVARTRFRRFEDLTFPSLAVPLQSGGCDRR